MPQKISITDSHIVLGIAELGKLKEQLFSRGSKLRTPPSSKGSQSSLKNNTRIGWNCKSVFTELQRLMNIPITHSAIDSMYIDSVVLACEVPNARDFVHSVFSQSPDSVKAFTSLDPLQTWASGDLRTDIGRGFRGLYLQPVMQHFHIYDKRAYGLYELCELLRVPVKVTFGVSKSPFADLRYGNPLDLHPVARDFPDIPFIVSSLGGGFFRELLMLTTQCPNVYADTSQAGDFTTFQSQKITVKEQIVQLAAMAGPEKIVFASGQGNPFGDFSNRNVLEILDALSDFDSEAIENIFHGTIHRLLNDVDSDSASEKPASRLRLKRF